MLIIQIVIFHYLHNLLKMNLIKEILKEHSKSQKDKIVNYVNNDPKRFADLVAVFLAGPYR